MPSTLATLFSRIRLLVASLRTRLRAWGSSPRSWEACLPTLRESAFALSDDLGFGFVRGEWIGTGVRGEVRAGQVPQVGIILRAPPRQTCVV